MEARGSLCAGAVSREQRVEIEKDFYEDMVRDQEAQTRRLLAFLGLEWAPECLDFHANRRAVATASMTQVRRPAYRTSIGRWRRYEAHLGPLLAALGDPAQYGIEDEPE